MVTLVVCGILEQEVKAVIPEGCAVIILPPGLCIHPAQLKEELVHTLGEIENSKIVVYGRCFPEINVVCKKHAAERIEGENCYEIIAGDRYSQLLAEEPGTYFLLPQLCERFEELTRELSMEKMKDLYFKNYRRCIFLDTGVPHSRECSKIAEELGLPYLKEYTGTENLEKKLKDLLNKESVHEAHR